MSFLKVEYGKTYQVTLMYDSPKTRTNKFGSIDNNWGVIYDGQEMTLSAWGEENEAFLKAGKGTTFEIKRESLGNKKYVQNVTKLDDASQVIQNVDRKFAQDNKDEQITRAVAFKAAIETMPNIERLEADDIKEIQHRTNEFFKILTDPSYEGLPF